MKMQNNQNKINTGKGSTNASTLNNLCDYEDMEFDPTKFAANFNTNDINTGVSTPLGQDSNQFLRSLTTADFEKFSNNKSAKIGANQ